MHPLTRDRAPPVPEGVPYTQYYCEENVYLLARALLSSPWESHVVFISNRQKTVALWNQKVRDGPVVWDYHVVLVLRQGESVWVYDRDSRGEVPCLANEYMRTTFPYVFEQDWDIPEQYTSQFRVLPARTYLTTFVSDRSHMLVAGTEGDVTYSAPPPSYEPIRGCETPEGVVTNLMRFVCMGSEAAGKAEDDSRSGAALGGCDAGGGNASVNAPAVGEEAQYGEVMDMEGFLPWLGIKTRDGVA